MRRHDDGHVAALDWTVGFFNLLAGLICVSAAASNYIVYGISLRIASLMFFFSVSALVFIALEVVPLAGYTQRSASHLNSYAGRAAHYFLAAILASDTVFVHIRHYNLYIWLWSNSVALASISSAFVVLAVMSTVTDWIPKPRSMDVKRCMVFGEGKADCRRRRASMAHEDDVESSRTAFIGSEAAYDKTASMATIDVMSISSYLPKSSINLERDDRYTPSTSSLFEQQRRRRSSHAHGAKWHRSSPPAHASMWTGSTTKDDGSQCSTPRVSTSHVTGPRRFSSHSASPPPNMSTTHRYETTSQRANANASSSPPSAWSQHLAAAHDGVAGLSSSFHRELTYDAVEVLSEGEEDAEPSSKAARRLSPLRTQAVRAKSIRKRVFIPSAGAAIELSSGESSSDKNSDNDSDDESVYSLPSGISPSQDKASTAAEVTEKADTGELLGRRLSRKETRSLRHKIKRGLDRAAA